MTYHQYPISVHINNIPIYHHVMTCVRSLSLQNCSSYWSRCWRRSLALSAFWICWGHHYRWGMRKIHEKCKSKWGLAELLGSLGKMLPYYWRTFNTRIVKCKISRSKCNLVDKHNIPFKSCDTVDLPRARHLGTILCPLFPNTLLRLIPTVANIPRSWLVM